MQVEEDRNPIRELLVDLHEDLDPLVEGFISEFDSWLIAVFHYFLSCIRILGEGL